MERRYYPITREGNTVGEAQLERQGMFWRIICRCRIRTEKPMRIYLQSEMRRLDLGLCILEGDTCSLVSRISCKVGAPEGFAFTVEHIREEQYFPLSESEPFPALQLLKSAKFMPRNGHPGILINN